MEFTKFFNLPNENIAIERKDPIRPLYLSFNYKKA